MNPELLLDELLDLAGKLGFQVRQEFLAGEGGGLCRLKGKWVLFIDTALPIRDRCEQAARALSSQNFDDIYLVPEIRDIIEQTRNP